MKFKTTVFVLFICTLSAFVFAEQKKSTEEYIKTATKQISLKQYEEALETLRNAQKEYPNQEEIAANFGLVHLGLRNYKTSKQYYEKVLKTNPDHFRALLGVAICQIMTGELMPARNALRKIDEKYPDNLETVRYYDMITFMLNYKEKYGKFPEEINQNKKK